MDSNSADKVQQAGFSIIRKADDPTPRIKIRNGDSAWALLKKFDTKTARDKYYIELMKDPKTIND